jgi:uncharacterized protein involved in outer membrane biogenesis
MTGSLPEDFEARDEGREALLAATAAPPPKKKRKWLRRVLIGTPVALGVFVLMIPTIASSGFVRRKMEASMTESMGRAVTLEDHSVSWSGLVTASGFRIAGEAGGKDFLEVKEVEVDLNWRPLFSGKVEMNRLEVTGVKMHVVRRKDGTMSTDSLGKGPKRPAGAEEKPREMKWGPIEVKDVAIEFVDEGMGTTFVIRDLGLDAKPGSSQDEVVAELAAAVQAGDAPAGRVKLNARLVALQDGRPRENASGKATFSFEGIDGGAIGRVLAPSGEAAFATGAMSGSMDATIAESGDIEAKIQADVPALRVGKADEPAAVETPVAMMHQVAWRKGARRLEIVKSETTMTGMEASLQGHVVLPDGKDARPDMDLVLRANGRTADWSKLFPKAFGEKDQKGLLTSTVSAKGSSDGVLVVKCVAELVNYRFLQKKEDGTTSEWKVPHPGLFKMELAAEIDARRGEALRAASPGHPWGNLLGVTATLGLRAPWVQNEDVDLKQIFVDAALKDTRAELRAAEVVVNGGKVTATGGCAFDAADPVWRMTNTGTGIEYSYAFSKLAALVNPMLYARDRGGVQARMGWDVELSGRGTDPETAKASLLGTGRLRLEQGSLSGSKLLGVLLSALKLADEARYEFAQMTQEFEVRDRRVYNRLTKFQGEGKEADLAINGWTGFDGAMQQRILIEGDATARWGKTTGTVIAVYNKAGGLPLGGTVEEPKIDIDYEAALKGAVSGLLESQEVQEKVEDLLNDLFKKKKKKK